MKTPLFPNNIPSTDMWKRRLNAYSPDKALGIIYHWEFASKGADFFLLREAHHSEQDIDKAAEFLKKNHDINSIYCVDLTYIKKSNEQ
jgi:hypothetical protein